MPDPKPAKAKLVEQNPANPPAKVVTVQFNPETLKVSYANQVVPPKSEGNAQENASMQFVGTGTMKLSLQIWFDVTGEAPGAAAQATDVRTLTRDVSYFMTPVKNKQGDYVPPQVSFEWGTFTFKGIMDSLEESLEFFSSEGVPLRASMTLGLSRQLVDIAPPGGGQAGGQPPGAGGPGAAAAGTLPLTPARAGDTLQGLAAGAAAGVTWQAIAAANGIENPRLLPPGKLLDLSVKM
jgi:Contractile injection system tube protein/LysM domain